MARKLNAQAIANITRRMRAVPEELKRAAEAEIVRVAEKMAADMRRDVPVDEGDLYDTIKVVQLADDGGQIAVRIQAGGERTTDRIGTRTYDREVRIGSGDTAGRTKKAGGFNVTYDYAVGVEFGTSRVPARPYFWPNYRRHKKRVKAALSRVIRKAAKDLDG